MTDSNNGNGLKHLEVYEIRHKKLKLISVENNIPLKTLTDKLLMYALERLPEIIDME